jgi:cation diffusion facilitator family transporter
LADALTSISAIVALLAAKYFGFIWMDPLMGIVGSILVAHWSLGLVRTTAGVLLDRQGPEDVRCIIKKSIEKDGDSRVADLHLWSIGQNTSAVALTIVASNPATPDQYKDRIPKGFGLEHITIEIHQCPKDEECELSKSTPTL